MTALNLNALREAAEKALNEDAVHGHVPPVIRAKLSAGYRDFLRGKLAEKCTPATVLKLIAIAEAARAVLAECAQEDRKATVAEMNLDDALRGIES